MRKLIMTTALLGAIAAPASAQNVANNNGIWWGGPAGGPSAFTLLNPLTTVYGRIGVTHAWRSTVGYTIDISPFAFTLDASNTYGFIAAIGARLMPAIRYELQFGGSFNGRGEIRRASFPTQQVQRFGSFQVMNNLFLDVAPLTGGLGRFNAYAMGGVGVSFNYTSDLLIGVAPAFTSIRGTGAMRTEFAWNIGAGGQYQIFNNLILDVGYRFLGIGRFSNSASVEGASGGHSSRVSMHQVMVSIVVPFDGLARGFGN